MKIIKLYATLFLLSLGITGCATAGKNDQATEVVKMQVAASKTINPDITNKPSPVVIIIYQLNDNNVFKNSDFFDLYRQPKATLGADYLSSKELMITPGEKQDVTLNVNRNTRFIGVLAAYQQSDKASWLASAPIKSTSDFKHLAIHLDNLQVKITNGSK